MTFDAADGYVLLAWESQTWSFLHGAWTNRTTAAGGSSQRELTGPLLAFDPLLNATVALGENPFSNHHYYTWIYSHGVWGNATQGPQPEYSFTTRLLWDSSSRQLLLVGCNATFAFVNNVWTPQRVVGSTCDTGGVNMADDPEVSGLLAYGPDRGINSGGFSPGPGETWTFVNDTWTSSNLNPSPPLAGSSSGMTYDSSQRKVVLFGGYSGAYSDQTWIYSNGSWRNVTAVPLPGGSGAGVAVLVGVGVVVAVFSALVAIVAIRRRRATRGKRR
jgi:hypothetical protein